MSTCDSGLGTEVHNKKIILLKDGMEIVGKHLFFIKAYSFMRNDFIYVNLYPINYFSAKHNKTFILDQTIKGKLGWVATKPSHYSLLKNSR
jgi:hypothetical protein